MYLEGVARTQKTRRVSQNQANKAASCTRASASARPDSESQGFVSGVVQISGVPIPCSPCSGPFMFCIQTVLGPARLLSRPGVLVLLDLRGFLTAVRASCKVLSQQDINPELWADPKSSSSWGCCILHRRSARLHDRGPVFFGFFRRSRTRTWQGAHAMQAPLGLTTRT